MARRTVSTTGHGRASREPDLAEVRVGVQLVRPSAAVARTDAAAVMQGVVAAVRGTGIDARDARTARVAIGPSWDYPPNKSPRLAGYQATNQLVVTVRAIERVAEVVDAAVSAGATTVEDIGFRTSPALTSDAASEALAAAVADARSRAEVLAREAGASLGGVRSIEEVPAADGGVRPLYALREAAVADTPVLPGTSDIEVAVRVVFELGAGS